MQTLKGLSHGCCRLSLVLLSHSLMFAEQLDPENLCVTTKATIIGASVATM